jgi:hypothetical protein
MMGSKGGAAADPLSGLIAALADPNAAAEKLAEIKAAQDSFEEVRRSLFADQEAAEQRKLSLDEREAALSKREAEIAASEAELAERDASIVRAMKLAEDKEAKLKKKEADQAEKHAARKAEIAEDLRQVKAERAEAERISAEANARYVDSGERMIKAEEAMKAAEALKAEYEGKIKALAAIVKG